MAASLAATETFQSWNQPSFEVRVRGTQFLWGSAGINTNLGFAKPLIFHVRNSIFGEPVTLGTRLASGQQTNLGTLLPGECVSLELQGICGVVATCQAESLVGCMIKE